MKKIIQYKVTAMKFAFATYPVFMLIILTSCLDMNDSLSDVKPTKYFNQKINVENSKIKYLIGDTLWINATIPDSMVNLNTWEMEVLSNETFIFSGELYLLKPLYDSLSFINQNFELVISDGSFDYANVIDGNYSTYMFSIKFGKPVEISKIRFGIVPKYLGAFSFEASTQVYYGDERTDYNDFSQDNELGYISLNFNLSDINESVYDSLPSIYRQQYDYYYTRSAINAKQFYFIDVSDEVD